MKANSVSTNTSSSSSMISLEQFSTFQYMLAWQPSVAQPIVRKITSLVFYSEPRDSEKSEDDHRVLLAKKKVTLLDYYFCCLWVLPSHALRMSQWISATGSSTTTCAITKSQRTFQPTTKILRHFRYSFFAGALQVDTYHVQDTATTTSTTTNEGPSSSSSPTATSSFRIVEFFEIDHPMIVYMVSGGFYVGIFAVLIQCWKFCAIFK